MKRDRSRLSLLNLGSGSLKNVLTTLIGFVSTPYIVRSVGDSDFGLYKTLISFYGHFSLLELGLYSTTLSLFIKESSGAFETTHQILQWGIRKYLSVMKTSLLFSVGFSIWLYFEFRKDAEPSELIMALIFCQAFFLVLPTLPYKAYLESHHEGYRVNLLQLLNAVLYTLFALSLTYLLPGLSSLMLATIIGLGVSSLGYRIFTPAPLKVAVPLTFKMDNKLQLSYFLNEVSGRICLMSDDIIISLMIGPKYVVPFFITQKLPQLIQIQLLNIGNSTWSTLGLLYHQGEMDLFKKRLLELTKLAAVFGASCLVVLAVFNRSFVELWIGPKEYGGQPVTLITCLNAYLLPIFTIWGWCFNFSQLVNVVTPMMWIQAIVNLSLSILFTKWWGIQGAILGTLVAYVTIPLPWLSVMLKKHFRMDLIRLHLSWSLPLIVSIGIYLAAKAIPGFDVCTTWSQLMTKMGLSGALVLTLYSVVFFSRTEMKEHLERVRKLFRKK